MAALGLGGIAHFALVIATDGHPSRRQLAITALTLRDPGRVRLPGIVDPGISRRRAAAPAARPIPGAVLGWAWVVARLAALALGAGWLLVAMRTPDPGRSGSDSSGRRWRRSEPPASGRACGSSR